MSTAIPGEQNARAGAPPGPIDAPPAAETQASGGSFSIGKRFTFDAAHHLSTLPAGHKCARVHGHTYTVEVVLGCDALSGPGWVTDFGDLAPLGRYIDAHLDHQDLNQVLAVEPTSEQLAQHLAEWIIANLEPLIPGRLESVRVSETPNSWASFAPQRERAAW